MVSDRPKRLYQVWKGSNKFLCGGRSIFGPDVASLFLTIVLISGPVVAFCSQIISKIHGRINHPEISDHNNILGLPVLIVTIIIVTSDLIFLFLTSSRDPGIVPRNAQPPESSEAFDANTPSMEWINGRTPHLKLPRTKEVVVNGYTVKVKFCDTCLLYRPPRASHCSVCNNCVQKFDHHCPWVGQCIGLRNYRFFFLFISTSTFLCIFVFTISWLNIIGEKKIHNFSYREAIRDEIVSLILIVYTFIAVWFVGGLTCFHTYLTSTNQTTYENFRYHYDKKENPFDKGILRNFRELFFSKIPPSMNDFRSWVLEDIETGHDAPDIAWDVVNPMENIDTNLGNELPSGSNMNMTSILQKLEYGSPDDGLNTRDKIESKTNNPLDDPVEESVLEDHPLNDSVEESVLEEQENSGEIISNEIVVNMVDPESNPNKISDIHDERLQ